ncbi:MAG: SdpI family protein [Verrucomicrobiia bacterium]
MNDYYGFRVEAAFASKDRWYAINEYSGRVLAKWSVLPIGAGLAGFFLPSEWFVEYASAATFFLVCSAAIPLLLTFRWIRKTYGVQQDPAPNVGPATPVGSAGVTKGPPSVS